jgi:hypothetical protein
MINVIQNMLDLSTAHMPGPNPDWGGARAESHAFGWILFLSDRDDEAHLPCPEWLKPIVLYALDNDCILVNFDQDGDIYEVSDLETLAGTKTGFKTYNW